MESRNRHRRKSGSEFGYSDDTTIIAGTEEELLEIMERIRKTNEKVGLYL